MNKQQLLVKQEETQAALSRLREELGLALLGRRSEVPSVRSKLRKAEEDAEDIGLMMRALDLSIRNYYPVVAEARRHEKAAEAKRLIDNERRIILAAAADELGAKAIGSAKSYIEQKWRFQKDYPALINPIREKAVLVNRARLVIELARSSNMLNDAKAFFKKFGGSPELLKYI